MGYIFGALIGLAILAYYTYRTLKYRVTYKWDQILPPLFIVFLVVLSTCFSLWLTGVKLFSDEFLIILPLSIIALLLLLKLDEQINHLIHDRPEPVAQTPSAPATDRALSPPPPPSTEEKIEELLKANKR